MKEQSPWWWWNKDSRRRSGGAKSAESRHLIQSILRGDITNSNEISHLCRRSLMQALGALLLRHILCALPIIIFLQTISSSLLRHSSSSSLQYEIKYTMRWTGNIKLCDFIKLVTRFLARFALNIKLNLPSVSPSSESVFHLLVAAEWGNPTRCNQ